jgi:ABC-2 type transport system permease protein
MNGGWFRRTAALVRINAMMFVREPGPVVSRLVMPLILIAVLRPLYVAALADAGTDAGTAQVVSGNLVMFSLLALSIVGSAVLTEREWRTWDRLRATRAAPWELILGKSVPAFGVLVVQQVLVLGAGAALFGLRIADLGLLAATVCLWVVTLLAVGTALGAFARSHSELAVFYDLGGLTLTVLGGALIPLQMLPHWARVLAPVSPGYWAMTSFRAALDGNVHGLVKPAVVLVTLTVVAETLACWRITQGWGRTKRT